VLGQKVNHRIDLRGMVYPLSKLETRLTLKKMAAGDVLEVLTDFLPIRQAISLLIREHGYAYELVETDRQDFRFFIQKT
jgi:TusA-related sulfurtransferase